MAIQLIGEDKVGELKTIGIHGDRWKRIVIVVEVNDFVRITNVDGDPNKLLLEVSPPVNTNT